MSLAKKTLRDCGYRDLPSMVCGELQYTLDSDFVKHIRTEKGFDLYLSATGRVLAISPDHRVYKSMHLSGVSASFKISYVNMDATFERIKKAKGNEIEFDEKELGVELLAKQKSRDLLSRKYLYATLNGHRAGRFCLEDHIGSTVDIAFHFRGDVEHTQQKICRISGEEPLSQLVGTFCDEVKKTKLWGKVEAGKFYLQCSGDGKQINFSSELFTSHKKNEIEPETATEALRAFFSRLPEEQELDVENLLLIHTHRTTTPVSYLDNCVAQSLATQLELPVEIIAVSPIEDIYFSMQIENP